MRSAHLRDAFLSLRDHPWFKRVFKRLSEDEIQFCNIFINYHGEADVGEFERAVSRMFMDKPTKPKRWLEIQDLLLAANSIAKEKI